MNNEEHWIRKLEMQPHTEGGYFKEVLKSAETLVLSDGRKRPLYTSIYFLLNQKSPSHFHQLLSDEVWYYHAGRTLTIHMLYPDGRYEQVKLGNNIDQGEILQYCVPKGVIFGSSVDKGYALVSCMVSPGFDYRDFTLFTQSELIEKYPESQEIIGKLAYKELPN